MLVIGVLVGGVGGIISIHGILFVGGMFVEGTFVCILIVEHISCWWVYVISSNMSWWNITLLNNSEMYLVVGVM